MSSFASLNSASYNRPALQRKPGLSPFERDQVRSAIEHFSTAIRSTDRKEALSSLRNGQRLIENVK